MFDLLLYNDFKKNVNLYTPDFTFANLPYYNEIKKIEYKVKLNRGLVVYLERNENEENYFSKDNEHLFLFGSVFTNNNYTKQFNIKPKKINSSELYTLYYRYGIGTVNYIKGSFVVVLFNDTSNECIMISDRHNVLPFYYYFKNGLLIISSSLRLLTQAANTRAVDKTALTQQLIFDYTLDDRTYFEEIKRVKPASIYKFNDNEFKCQQYWEVKNLYHSKLLKRNESLDLLAEQLYENVQLYTSDSKRILVSLTGGFDGRTNLAMLRKNKDEYLCYSYGMPGSRQIQIPESISKKLNIPYTPVYCDEDFERQYPELGQMVVEFSNGTAPFTQAVFPYAYSRLSKFSNTILTGLFGSEILRPLHNLGIIINDFSERIFLSDDPKSEIRNILTELTRLKYLNDNIIKISEEEVIENIFDLHIKRFEEFDKITRFFMFIIEEGIRKYFSQEIQSERVYVTTRFPYFDNDFIDLIYKTTFAGMYNGFLGKSKYKRRKGQLLYAWIMKKYNPELLNIKLDRGYKPADLIKPFPINYLFIGYGVYKTKRYYSKIGNDTFDTTKWAKDYLEYSRKSFTENDFFKKEIIEFNELDNDKKRLKFAHLLSIYNYLNN